MVQLRHLGQDFYVSNYEFLMMKENQIRWELMGDTVGTILRIFLSLDHIAYLLSSNLLTYQLL